VALPAFTAVHHAAARLLLTAGLPAVQKSISPGRRAHSSKPAAVTRGGRMRQRDRQTDGRPTDA